MEAGTWWRIGDGSTIRIYEDHWLPRPLNVQGHLSLCAYGFGFVNHLKHPSGGWNVSLIKENFCDEDASLIMSIPHSNLSGKLLSDLRCDDNVNFQDFFYSCKNVLKDGDFALLWRGAVIRDHRGLVNAASSQRIDMRFTVEIAEAVAVLDIYIEVMSAHHILRQANGVAHSLAKLANLDIPEGYFLLEEAPPSAERLVLEDVLG
ncbi:hypothetical protein EZV62_001724 [Acer yangbiense]|uniref:Uncharacterized protein n=1 Tax=Acer yangbiense TaxID=1000413 RepID=A0A5C7IVD6_9ROSI|nr:hypothetical protein EZV62_001724 [Acer yangbiense]